MKVLKNNYFGIAALCILSIGVFSNMSGQAGSLNPSDPPGVTMKTLNEIYDAVVANANQSSQREGYLGHIHLLPGASMDFFTVPEGRCFVVTKVFFNTPVVVTLMVDSEVILDGTYFGDYVDFYNRELVVSAGKTLTVLNAHPSATYQFTVAGYFEDE